MGILINFSKKKPKTDFSISKWLDEYTGCNVDKMMSGDEKEIEKRNNHMAKRNLIERTKMIDE